MTTSNGIVTLLTDFGTVDSYVGAMKGAMLQINPKLTLVDLTHQIPPQDIDTAAFQLQSACPFFPVGTVHLAVVDPGVGSLRQAIALANEWGFWVGPNNGIFSAIVRSHLQNMDSQSSSLRAIQLNRSQYWRNLTPSRTFHGRDIFGPVAAHLASGVAFADLGDPVDIQSLAVRANAVYQAFPKGVRGIVQAIDGFGNAITNIPSSVVPDCPWAVMIAGHRFPGQRAYSDVAWGHAIALVGSRDWVELAIYGGNAAQQMGLSIGTSAELTWDTVSAYGLP